MSDQASDRRAFLRRAGLAGFGLLAGGAALGEEEARPRLIVREKSPVNLEFPFASLDSFLTPNALFYVRNHYPQPKVDLKAWRLEVVGAVRKPLRLTYDEMRKLSAQTRPLTLECAGNGRAFLRPKAKGVQWELGAVSTAEWTGVPLAELLDRSGVSAGAVEVILEGVDRGDPKKEMQPPGLVSFARSLPLAKARRPEVLLAYRMNGKDLPPEHGHPVRAVVGGWYGMASVKWLRRIVVTTRPFHGFDQTVDYSVWEKRDGLPTLTAITEADVKASIARPAEGEKVPAGKEYRVHGAAWAGESEVAKVEVSTDGGKNWGEARLLGRPVEFCWRLWEYRWRAPAAGKYTLKARATDKRGRAQPTERDPGRRNYMISHVRPTPVTVGEVGSWVVTPLPDHLTT
jgi:DMSO/TMAO reductase YedYZ molybdopterin-dependent catalytic subunit